MMFLKSGLLLSENVFPAKAGIHVAVRKHCKNVFVFRFRERGVDPHLRGGSVPGYNVLPGETEKGTEAPLFHDKVSLMLTW